MNKLKFIFQKEAKNLLDIAHPNKIIKKYQKIKILI
jgi:hypothetical protein